MGMEHRRVFVGCCPAVLVGMVLGGCGVGPAGKAWSLDVQRETTAAIAPTTMALAVPAQPVVAAPPPPPRVEARSVGPAYDINGQTFTPKIEPDYDVTGFASWYGVEQHGTKTAAGEVFNAAALTAAHPTLPMPCYVLVTNLANGRTIMLRVNDRGPFAKSRIIDVSKAAADALGFAKNGVARVRVKYAGAAPRDGNDARETAFLAKQGWWQAAQTAGQPPPPVAVVH